MCLTLHQPWASLIIHGFKRAEGRSWNVDGKNKHWKSGRLWIHAALQQPDEASIKSIEAHYKRLYSEGYFGQSSVLPPFPSETGQGYPTGCILGCVDCLGNLHSLLSETFRNPYSDVTTNCMYNTTNFCIVPVLLR